MNFVPMLLMAPADGEEATTKPGQQRQGTPPHHFGALRIPIFELSSASMATLSERAVDYFHYVLEVRKKIHARYHELSLPGKVVVWCFVAFHVLGMLVVFLAGPEAVFGWMAGWAESLRDAEYGWLLLLLLITMTSIPPMMGYGTCITLCGFAFGVRDGWLLAVTGCLAGATVSFLLARRLIGWFAPLLATNETFMGLSSAVRAKGLPLVVLIRLCPFPFPYSNAFFASIESVSLFHFLVATLTITPKLFLHVWLGSRLFLFADPEERGKMDSNAKLINGIYVFVGSVLGFGTSWYLYRLTMQYVEEAGVNLDDLESGLIHDVDEMLNEDNSSDDEALTTPIASTHNTPLLPSRTLSISQPPPSALSKSDQKKPRSVSPLIDDGTPRMSTDNWEGNFSDFDEPEEEVDEDALDDEDPFGLGLGKTNERPKVESHDSNSTIRDKRRD